jgi:hypothetical protein
MRLVEIIGCHVVDADGQTIGEVHDVRVVADGPPDANGRPGYRLDALLAGTGGMAHKLGYSDDAMAGPWPLTSFFRRQLRRSLVVPWADVVAIGRPSIRIGSRRADLRSLADADERRADA